MVYDTAPERERLRTTCGRTIEIGRLALPGTTVERVIVDVSREDHDYDELWMSLTPGEARDLATLLARQAATAEATVARPAQPSDDAIGVVPLIGHAYQVEVRGHRLVVGQPPNAQGVDLGPQPLELFVGGLAACVVTFAGSYLTRNGIDTRGLRARCSYDIVADHPLRVGAVRITIDLPAGVPPERRAPLLAMTRHCTACNTFAHPPSVAIDLARPAVGSTVTTSYGFDADRDLVDPAADGAVGRHPKPAQ